MNETKQSESTLVVYDAKKMQNDIYMTRKSRINAETRLLSTERFIQGINIYYSCYAVIISIISLVSTNSNFSLLSVIFTVALAISIVYLNAQRFGERANDLKTNYIAMQGLIYEISSSTDDDIEELSGIQRRYLDLLSNCENHRNIDYLTSLKYSNKLDGNNLISYKCHRIFTVTVYCIAIAMPILLLYLAVCVNLDGIITP